MASHPSLKHREKVLAHAEARLASQGKYDPQERLALYQKFLKIENHRLRLRHNAGGGGREIARSRATLVDIVLRHLYDHAARAVSTDLALVAIGGFGRGELNPCSDVDIMFLHADSSAKAASEVAEAVQSVLYMLWDIGFKVGHSTRSVGAAVKQANTDPFSKTALLESRRVAGAPSLFEAFQKAFDAKCVKGQERNYLQSRVTNQAERHEKHSNTIYLQEPNVKNGCGSLRDYQNLLWMSYFQERISTTAELVERKFLSDSERRELERAYDFLLRVRTELHYLAERPNDVLSLNLQFTIADHFQYPQRDILRRSEAFMRDYYTHSRSIYWLTELLSQRLSIRAAEEGASHEHRIFGLIPRRPKKVEAFDGFKAIEGKLHPETPQIFRDDPFRMMRLFQHAQQRKLELSPELRQLVRRRLRCVDRTFQYARANRIVFTSILSRKGEVGRILRMMHEVDFLGRFIPEFGGLTCLVQHEFFHRYTADEHTLKCIDQLDQLIDTEDPKLRRYRALFQKLQDPYVLYLALLLHDVGKAANAKNHAEASALAAQKVARRLQLTPEQRRSMISLVDNHLYLSEVAQRRNLDDPETIREAATVTKNQTDLDRLMLLTLADGQGTNDEKWSDWKETLMWMLYEEVATYFEDSAAFFRQQETEREELLFEVTRKTARDFADEIEALFETMPDSYFRGHSAQDIVGHLRLFREFMVKGMQDGALGLVPAVKWITHPERGHSEIWVVTWNRKDLFAKIAGSLAAEGINILNADIYTRADDLVLDIFRVCDTGFQPVTERKAMDKVERHLTESLRHERFDFRPLLERTQRRHGFHLSQRLDFPTRIVVANDSSPSYTMVEVQTPDRIGLLYNLLRSFSRLKVDIARSRISTEKGAAIDTFYVRGPDGKKITNAESIRRMHRALNRAATRRTASLLASP